MADFCLREGLQSATSILSVHQKTIHVSLIATHFLYMADPMKPRSISRPTERYQYSIVPARAEVQG